MRRVVSYNFILYCFGLEVKAKERKRKTRHYHGFISIYFLLLTGVLRKNVSTQDMNGPELVPKRIAVIGELNVDLVATGLSGTPLFGQEILANGFEITLGSASAIFACGCASLGNEVTFVGSTGRDDFGKFCVEALKEKGILTDALVIKDVERTGATIVLSGLGDRALVTYPGAISTFGINDFSLETLQGKDHLHLTSYYLQAALRPDFPRLMREARTQGLSVSFDPNSDPSGQWDSDVFEVIELADILFVNETEAKALTSREDIKGALAELGKLCPCVVIKRGSDGVVAARDGDLVSAGVYSVEAIDTTGAGDSFAAGFVTAHLNGLDLQDCLQTGNACGALSTRTPGGTNSQPSLDEIKKLIKGSGIAIHPGN